jgi:hypothetical protein
MFFVSVNWLFVFFFDIIDQLTKQNREDREDREDRENKEIGKLNKLKKLNKWYFSFYHFWFIKLLLFRSKNLCLKSIHSLLRVYLPRINSNAFVLFKIKKQFLL